MSKVQYVSSVDPKEYWKQTKWQWLVRLRVIFGISGIKLVMLYPSVKLIGIFPEVCLSIATASVVGVLFYWRSETIRQIRYNERIHSLFHQIREDLVQIVTNTHNAYSTRQHEVVQMAKAIQREYRTFYDRTAENVAAVYRDLLRQHSLQCGIKMANKANAGTETYETVGRSHGMNKDRDSSTRPIPADEGIPGSFRSRRQRGVYIINSIEEARNQGIWFYTPNDTMPDIQKVMIAPINQCKYDQAEGTLARSTMGLLYLTSPDKDFTIKEVDHFRGIADFLGTVLPQALLPLQLILEANHG